MSQEDVDPFISTHASFFSKPIQKRISHDFHHERVARKTILTASPMRGNEPGRLGKCDHCLPINK